MSKASLVRFTLLIVGIVFILHACKKDQGALPIPPFNFSVLEDFEHSSNLPAGWSLWNPNNDAAWQVVTTVGHKSHNCVGFNNCSGNGTADMTGRKDRLYTPQYDFSQATNVSLAFDVTYAVLNVHAVTYTDTLAVWASVDGGVSWTRLYYKGGSDLTNIPIITTSQPCWTPDTSASSTCWRTDKITVNSVAGKSKVMFAFENISGWGEWIFLDNISIKASSGTVTNCSGITFSKVVGPILNSNCALSGCHDASSGRTDFSSYAGAKSAATSGSLKKRMIDGNPSFMPTSGKLADSTLSKVQCWLDAGAPNN